MFQLVRERRENERSKRGRSEFVLIPNPNHVFGMDVFNGMQIAGFSHNDCSWETTLMMAVKWQIMQKARLMALPVIFSLLNATRNYLVTCARDSFWAVHH